MAEDGQRGIAAHRAGGFRAAFRHGEHDGLQILVAVAEGLLEPHHFFSCVGGDFPVGHRQVGKVYQIPIQPFAVGLAAGVLRFQVLVVYQLALHRVHQQHLAGAQAVFADDMLLRDVQNAHLAGQNQPSVVGDVIAAGAQTVAVKDCAHHVAVAEQNGRRAVPGLQHGSIILVKVLLLLIHVPVVAPRLRDGDHHRQRQIHAVHDHEFQGVVQHGRVGTALIDNRQHLGHIVLQKAAGNGLLTGEHGVHVATDGVDLAVVENEPVGVRPVPAGRGVGGEAAVNHADGGLVVLVLQIRVELPQLLDQKHALIHDGAAGQAAHIGLLAGLLEHPARHIQPPVKSDPGLHSRRLSHKRLPDAGHTVPRLLPQILRAHRHLPPAQEGQPLLFTDDLKKLLRLIALQFLLGEEEHAHAVFPLRAQGNARGRGCLHKEFVADL